MHSTPPARRTIAAVAVALTALTAGCSTAATTAEPAAGTTTPEAREVVGVEIAVDPEARALVPETFLDSGTVRVATDVPYPPFEMYEDEGSDVITGLDYDLGQAIGAVLGLEFAFEAQKFDGIIPAIQAGKYDITISAMTDTVERQGALTFVDYSASGTGMLVADGNPEGIETYTDLCGLPVGVQSGTQQVDLVESWAAECEDLGAEPVDLKQYPKDSDAQLAISSGAVVASLLTKPAAGYVAKTAGDGATFDSIDDPAAPNGYGATPNGIGVSNTTPELAEAIQVALQSLIDDGTYEVILDKYGLTGIAVDEATINGAES
ncbi:amino acid ABC transporter substrate-binding protein (PAAT family) [Isoptericola sp. CG 20/1183]|uniref:Amino acid ABC transporter substrate-binding protein (PAAT family) n=1 Tax=Isoptericola halotolerans TaxID=300560 RepID=A0ABX5EEA7_9MICO|nr:MULTISPECIES: ABC transporter substrate-binding protein [Isoptericola]PRZ06880.1 amino acid ABC transporter substrate-binding protein (PAAT family) [Isoptericola halotolerans]PRZ07448.1 amino acid ABC transporter substrate-binding protein (PAAT family) [Isoptericola sp. CG 20/1183]